MIDVTGFRPGFFIKIPFTVFRHLDFVNLPSIDSQPQRVPGKHYLVNLHVCCPGTVNTHFPEHLIGEHIMHLLSSQTSVQI